LIGLPIMWSVRLFGYLIGFINEFFKTNKFI